MNINNQDPANWSVPELMISKQWSVGLTSTDIAELKQALQLSIESGVDMIDIKRENFALPGLGPKLEQQYQQLINGRGFVVLHDLPVESMSREEVIRAWLGIGSWLGTPVSQNRKGHILGHVKDIGLDPHNPKHRVYGTSYRQPYHTDSCDIVGLLCLNPAKAGGTFTVSSSVSIFNEMQRRRPELAKLLELPFVVDRKGEVPEGKQSTYKMAIFHHHEGAFAHYSRPQLYRCRTKPSRNREAHAAAA